MATTATHIGPADHGRPMSIDEFLEADEEPGYRYELAKGVVEVSEIPEDWHGVVVSNLFRAGARYCDQRPGLIRRFGGASEFRLWMPGMISARNPDFGVVLHNAPKNRRGRRVPALAAEVVSEGGEDRDYVTKREEYLKFGLFEYWIVDRYKKQVVLLVRDGDAWSERILKGDDTIASHVLAGFDATVASLWADVEEN